MKRRGRGGAIFLSGVVGGGLAVALFVAATAVSAQSAPSGQAAPSSPAGEAAFQSKCVGCHTIGHGALVGPDLQGVAARRSHDWLVSWITAPDQLIARGDPIAQELVKQFPVQMPNMSVSPAEAEALLNFIAAPPAGGVGAAAAAAASLPPGDPVVGEAYFDGTRRLQHGGPPCIGCHSFGAIGALGGGVLGPDLSGATAKYGDPGLASFLASVPTVTMNSIWSQTPLTPEEQASLAAFLKQPVVQRPTDALVPLTALTVAGTALLLVLAHLVWRRRLAGVRRRMVALRRLPPRSPRLTSQPGTATPR